MRASSFDDSPTRASSRPRAPARSALPRLPASRPVASGSSARRDARGRALDARPPEIFSAASLRPDAASADEAQTHKEAGNALFVREAWRDAIERYDSSVRLDASRASTFTNRAAARFALFRARGGASEELMLALRDAERSLEIDPRWVKGHYRAGACLARLCDFAAARDAFLAGAEIDPRNEQIKSALRDVQMALEETPRDCEDAKTRGNAKYRDGKYEDAVRWYTRRARVYFGNG